MRNVVPSLLPDLEVLQGYCKAPLRVAQIVSLLCTFVSVNLSVYPCFPLHFQESTFQDINNFPGTSGKVYRVSVPI